LTGQHEHEKRTVAIKNIVDQLIGQLWGTDLLISESTCLHLSFVKKQ